MQQHVISEEQAKALIKQAEDEAYIARQSAKEATVKADEAASKATAAAAAALPPGTKRVTYVPEIVKKELRDEVKDEVMTEAKKEGWASPGTYPEWASRLRFYGDLRLRYQGNYFPPGNDTSGNLVNYNAINTGPPFDPTSGAYPPTLDANADRNQFRFRARLGVDADLSDGFSSGIRIASGQDDSPVSQNQSFGYSGGAQGGNFSNYAVWLDRAFLKYQPNESINLQIGRFDSPFFHPTDLVWYKDLNFDGVATQAKYDLLPNFQPFVVAGAFPVFNTDFNFGTDQGGTKYSSTDKYLFAAQLGFLGNIAENVHLGLGASYYDFSDVQGRLSSPCLVTSVTDVCDTDELRPSFAQKGNTYMALRDIIPFPNGTVGPQFQYYGLASAFREIDLTGQLDFSQFDPVHIILDGEFVRNLAFDAPAIGQIAVNNLAGTTNGSIGPFNGGNTGYMARITVGHPELKQIWDWNVAFAYKYLQSDATVDAFVDPDFGGGGTNLKGFIVTGRLALSSNVWMTIKYYSANALAGPVYRDDTLQVDLNAKF
ncbi:MAG TPA: putative porin [Methylocella sp.]|nr:putative porin [Methylocella sp.]